MGFASGVWDNLYDEQLVDILREESDVLVSFSRGSLQTASSFWYLLGSLECFTKGVLFLVLSFFVSGCDSSSLSVAD